MRKLFWKLREPPKEWEDAPSYRNEPGDKLMYLKMPPPNASPRTKFRGNCCIWRPVRTSLMVPVSLSITGACEVTVIVSVTCPTCIVRSIRRTWLVSSGTCSLTNLWNPADSAVIR